MIKASITKDIKVVGHDFVLVIYLNLEGHKDVCWEIFSQNYKGSLFAFSNKERLKKLIENKYLYEAKK